MIKKIEHIIKDPIKAVQDEEKRMLMEEMLDYELYLMHTPTFYASQNVHNLFYVYVYAYDRTCSQTYQTFLLFVSLFC